jgi:ribulose 1,5-bisphosphate synthetase/thiazole synthase
MHSRIDLEPLIPATSETFDVIVAGGGPAGIGAALAASAQGARTLILEARSFFGGVAAIALWMPMNRLLLNSDKRGGVHDVFVQKIKSYGSLAWREGKTSFVDGDGLHIHPDYLRLACMELLEEYDCHYRLYSPVTGVLMNGARLDGVEVISKEGPQQFRAHVVVDATGDGDVACLAGAEMVQGREEDGQSMPVSLVFALANVDVERLFNFVQDKSHFDALIDSAAAEGFATAAWYSFDRTTLPDAVSVNNGALRDIGNIDGTCSSQLTIAERMGIQVATDFVKLAHKKRIPGLEKCCLMRVGATVGVRDTRRLVGEYIVTLEDARRGAEFPDTIARKYGAVDANQLYIGEMKSGFAFPYRSLLPKTVENLLVAGRCSSATFLGHAAGKSMGNMMELGQAAGVAAALCAAQGVSPRRLDVPQLQAVLRQMGVHL